ncbi:unnamed protein product [Rhizophagus irregularis]|nr:unnamed protein product [Rhizophagus irregularis]CAB4493015.1 unnamed protein product [Rhizophagus irregularis]CAB5184982.1 unnamed protein product [Rhizophagus irregularis]CAB5349617.1 unnamed protein product [Rhizophagus irregularis]
MNDPLNRRADVVHRTSCYSEFHLRSSFGKSLPFTNARSIFYAFLWTLNLLKQLVTSVYLLLALISFNVFSSFFYHCPKVY